MPNPIKMIQNIFLNQMMPPDTSQIQAQPSTGEIFVSQIQALNQIVQAIKEIANNNPVSSLILSFTIGLTLILIAGSNINPIGIIGIVLAVALGIALIIYVIRK